MTMFYTKKKVHLIPFTRVSLRNRTAKYDVESNINNSIAIITNDPTVFLDIIQHEETGSIINTELYI